MYIVILNYSKIKTVFDPIWPGFFNVSANLREGHFCLQQIIVNNSSSGDSQDMTYYTLNINCKSEKKWYDVKNLEHTIFN